MIGAARRSALTRRRARTLPSGLTLRLRADGLSGADASSVSSWPDTSSSARTAASQGTAASQPKLRTGFLNGRKVVQFDGTDDSLTLSGTALDTLRNVPGRLVVVVMRMTATTNDRTFFSLSSGTNQFGNRHVSFARAGAAAAYADRADNDSDTLLVAGSAIAASTWAIHTLAVDHSTGATALYVNGAQVATGTGTTGSTSDTRSVTGSIGSYMTASGGDNVAGEVAEILVWPRACSTAERAQVHSYVQDYYGIATSDYVAA